MCEKVKLKAEETMEDAEKVMLASYALGSLVGKKILRSGINLGMGTGSTIKYVLETLGYLLKKGELEDIAVVSTSTDTLYKCFQYDIPTYSLESERVAGHLDLCIDGADRFDNKRNLIKGGGGALFREKIVAYNADIFSVVAVQDKEVENLNCDFPVPIEVFPFAYKTVCLALEKRGMTFALRTSSTNANPFITENGNYILDAHYPKGFEVDPAKEELELNQIVGVVENGFFSGNKVTNIFSVAEGIKL